MYVDLSGLTLRQAIELAQINVELDKLSHQYHNLLDTKMFSGVYDYFLCDFTTLFEFLNLKNQKYQQEHSNDKTSKVYHKCYWSWITRRMVKRYLTTTRE
ncbi:hypothetical protein OGZ01_31275 (plasmid) [Vibrio harveyi]|nr:hypothetical protein [Vibrio harveyi]